MLKLAGDSYEMRLYVNGVLISDTPKTVTLQYIPSVKNFDHWPHELVGRAEGQQATRRGTRETAAGCYTWYSSEMCMAIDGVEVWDQGDLDCTETGNLNVDKVFTGSTSMVLLEDDDGPRCGAGPSTDGNDDDICQFTSPTTGSPLVFIRPTRPASPAGSTRSTAAATATSTSA